ncbi:retropepsin-like aspartic protease family protein [Quisquiliibacterium transsilvanicum]|uniref:Aspartyl protease family protein n=1 Tax=Quisquiliibacterium transsilvanicum TaxID=1549638 RepID=A0A7W8M8X5_9BURK|nr:retropepsin-like aspartic protease [Quisquiliibacterium transsilvanicum]MBB5272082.1 aspartyl protease family protein [Quisquiliibacterium transsilvanicum]
MSATLKRTTVVLAIGAALFFAFDRYGPWQSGRGWRPKPVETVSAQGSVLRRTVDGHYYANGSINGEPVVFMVDTGASTVAMGSALAERLGLGPCREASYRTAGGTVRGCEARADELVVAGLRLRDVRVGVLPDRGEDMLLLGMNVLRHFRIETEGGRMTLTPAPR